MTDFNEMNYGELSEHITDAITELRRKAYGAGYEQGKFDAKMDAAFAEVAKVVPEDTREDIVERAKVDVGSILRRGEDENQFGDTEEGNNTYKEHYYRVEFVKNKEKRTVVALVKRGLSKNVMHKGIAKCAPGDCFNSHIGEAIALRRALDLPVPDKYINTPQPTEAKVGSIFTRKSRLGDISKFVISDTMVNFDPQHNIRKKVANISIKESDGAIIDDSHV